MLPEDIALGLAVTLRGNQQLESRAPDWDPSEKKICVCGKKVLAIRKTKHLASMDGKTGNWLLFVTAQGMTWTRDGASEPDVASAVGDVSSGSSKGHHSTLLLWERFSLLSHGGLLQHTVFWSQNLAHRNRK